MDSGNVFSGVTNPTSLYCNPTHETDEVWWMQGERFLSNCIVPSLVGDYGLGALFSVKDTVDSFMLSTLWQGFPVPT